MVFDAEGIYHVYNRTFNKAVAFITRENYRFFLRKLALLADCCDLLCYCLMPDHFHFMIYVPPLSPGLTRLAQNHIQHLSRRIGTVLSSYTQAINVQERRTGSLFQPKTKAKLLDNNEAACFAYIHNNPVKAGLVRSPEDWEFSSFREYQVGGKGICNRGLAKRLFNCGIV